MLKDKISFQKHCSSLFGNSHQEHLLLDKGVFSGTEGKLSLNSRIIESIFLLGECSCPRARASLRSCSLFDLLFNVGVLERWSRSVVWKPRSVEGPVGRWLGPGDLLNQTNVLSSWATLGDSVFTRLTSNNKGNRSSLQWKSTPHGRRQLRAVLLVTSLSLALPHF